MPVLVGISLVTFLLVRFIPGDPATAILGARATPELIAQINEDIGLDRPIWEQYFKYVTDACRGRFGVSIFFQRSVAELTLERLPTTLQLIAYSMVITLILTVVFGSIGAAWKGGPADQIVRIGFTALLSMPSFWLGIILSLIVGVWWGILPVAGIGDGSFSDTMRHLTLPALTIALAVAPISLRSLRSSLIDVLQADFVTTGRAVGLSRTRLFLGYTMRNSILPTITVLSLAVGWLIGGTVVVEEVFGIPGLGSLLITAISTRDYAVIQFITVVMALFVVIVNLLTDLTYVLFDPRVSVE